MKERVAKNVFIDNEFIMNGSVQITDTHAHLCDEVFDPDRTQVIKRAVSAGIKKIICVSEDISDAKRNIDLAEKYPGMRPAAGLYPTCLDIEKAGEIIDFIKNNRERLFAIGEVGLDHWVVKEEPRREIQKEIFGMFIQLSREVDLPLNVHSRSAGEQTIHFLISRNANRVQLHAFDGKARAALPGVEAGFFFSIPPSIVRSRQKQKLVKQLPISCMLIETDSPVLGPDKGVRNEPVNAVTAIKAIAEIKGIDERVLIETLMENTRQLYGEMKGAMDEKSDTWKDRD